jgi:hypothetical protein
VVPEHVGATSSEPEQQCTVGVPHGDPASAGWHVKFGPVRVHISPAQQTAPLVLCALHAVPIGRHAGQAASQLTVPSAAHVHATDAPPGQLVERHVVPAVHSEPSGSVHTGGGGETSSTGLEASGSDASLRPGQHSPLHRMLPLSRHAHETFVPDAQCVVAHDVPTAHAP